METWTGELIGRMHNEHVTYQELADALGVQKSYISMILNCRKRPKNAKERLNEAFEFILSKRRGET